MTSKMACLPILKRNQTTITLSGGIYTIDLSELFNASHGKTTLKLKDCWFNTDAIRELCNFLTDNRCPIMILSLESVNFKHEADYRSFTNALGRNVSLRCLKIKLRMYKHNMIKLLMASLQSNKGIKMMHIDTNYMSKKLAQEIPKSIKHLHVECPKLTFAVVSSLLKINHLQTINLGKCKIELDTRVPVLDDIILTNTTVINFATPRLRYIFARTMQTYPYKSEAIKITLKRNKIASNAAFKAALCLMLIRFKRKNDYVLLGAVPKELVIQMAKWIYESYDESIWHGSNLFMTK